MEKTGLENGIHTILIAMVPVVELRGAIPYGITHELPFWLAFWLAFLGNLLPVPFIILFARRIFSVLRNIRWFDRILDWVERKAHVKGRIVNRYKALGLCVLVAIPLPGTGAWTGALVAAMLDIRLRNAMPAITLGLLLAGLVVTALSYSAMLTFGE